MANVDFIIADASGEITGWGSCPQADIAAQNQPSLGIHAVQAPRTTDPVANVVSLANPLAPALIARPSTQPVPTGPAWRAFQATAQAALNESDTTMHRISEAAALGLNSWTGTDVVAWITYRRALRAIVATGAGTPSALPPRPAYPIGT
jgi:hypothetical protein